jgi:hypothetical protein
MAGTVPVADLLARETTLSFAGLTPADQGDYPDAVSSEAWCLNPDPRSLKDVIATLPQANSGELWATNEFVEVDGTVDTEAIRDVHGLDVDVLEDAAGCSLDELATRASSDPESGLGDRLRGSLSRMATSTLIRPSSYTSARPSPVSTAVSRSRLSLTTPALLSRRSGASIKIGATSTSAARPRTSASTTRLPMSARWRMCGLRIPTSKSYANASSG